MARGRKKALTLEEQLTQVDVEIETAEKTLEELKNRKKELEEQIKASRIAELDELISSRGLTIDEVRELLEGQ